MRVLVLIGTALVAGPANAALDFDWDAPADCARPELSETVREKAGHAEVLVRRKGQSWLVTVMFFEPVAGLRRVVTTSCEEARKSAALLLKLGSESALPPEAPPTAPTARIPAPRPPPWRVSVGAGAVFDLGSLPVAEPRAALSASISRGTLGGALDARFGWPVTLMESIQIQRLAEVQLAGCLRWDFGRFTAGPCAALAVGSWRVVHVSGTAQTWVLSSSAQLRSSVALVAGLELAALAGVRFNLRRPAPFTDAVTYFSTPILAAELQLVLGWRW